MAENKKLRGQFYTVNSTYILEGLGGPPPTATKIIEPFAGKGDLLNLTTTLPIEAYDIEPKRSDIKKRDTLVDPPSYENAWIITNPPYLARNKCENKALFDKYDTNDLFKCFIHSVCAQAKCAGGIFIIPASFFLSPRQVDVKCRAAFMSQYRLKTVKYFEESVFPDTTTTVVAFSFERSQETLSTQEVEWLMLPSKERRVFTMSSANNWIVGGGIYNLPVPADINVRRHVEGQALQTGEQLTSMTLNALDSGTQVGRIALEYKEGYVYPAKDCSRTYATLCIKGRTLSADEQKKLCADFNAFVEKNRAETWSLFLPQFRESKEYARKRIPFELAYSIVRHLIQSK